MNTTDTAFDLASLTKVIATTTVAMLLWERGELKLDEPLFRMVPEFGQADRRREAVTRNLRCMALAIAS